MRRFSLAVAWLPGRKRASAEVLLLPICARCGLGPRGADWTQSDVKRGFLQTGSNSELVAWPSHYQANTFFKELTRSHTDHTIRVLKIGGLHSVALRRLNVVDETLASA